LGAKSPVAPAEPYRARLERQLDRAIRPDSAPPMTHDAGGPASRNWARQKEAIQLFDYDLFNDGLTDRLAYHSAVTTTDFFTTTWQNYS